MAFQIITFYHKGNFVQETSLSPADLLLLPGKRYPSTHHSLFPPLYIPPLHSPSPHHLSITVPVPCSMFLTDNHRSVPVPSSPYQSIQPHNLHLSHQFNEALSSRLASLLNQQFDLSWLSRATDVLSLTLADATSLILAHPSSFPPSRFLDSTSLWLLDSCNSVSSSVDRILNRLMFVRFSFRTHKPAFAEVVPSLEMAKIRPLSSSPEKASHGVVSPVQNAICAVEAVSALVISAISVILSGKGKECFRGLKVHGEILPWMREFNKVAELAYGRIEEGSVEIELEKMEKAVLKGELERNGGIKTMEKMREELEIFKLSVNAVFRAALCCRNAAVQNLRFAPPKNCK